MFPDSSLHHSSIFSKGVQALSSCLWQMKAYKLQPAVELSTALTAAWLIHFVLSQRLLEYHARHLFHLFKARQFSSILSDLSKVRVTICGLQRGLLPLEVLCWWAGKFLTSWCVYQPILSYFQPLLSLLDMVFAKHHKYQVSIVCIYFGLVCPTAFYGNPTDFCRVCILSLTGLAGGLNHLLSRYLMQTSGLTTISMSTMNVLP